MVVNDIYFSETIVVTLPLFIDFIISAGTIYPRGQLGRLEEIIISLQGVEKWPLKDMHYPMWYHCLLVALTLAHTFALSFNMRTKMYIICAQF